MNRLVNQGCVRKGLVKESQLGVCVGGGGGGGA